MEILVPEKESRNRRSAQEGRFPGIGALEVPRQHQGVPRHQPDLFTLPVMCPLRVDSVALGEVSKNYFVNNYLIIFNGQCASVHMSRPFWVYLGRLRFLWNFMKF